MPSSLIARESLPAERFVALFVAHADTVLLALGGPERWRALQSYTLAPIELPGIVTTSGSPPAGAAEAAAVRILGQTARILPSTYTYGSTATHAIDRLERSPLAGPAPLIYLERGLAPEDGASVPRRVEVCLYRGVLGGDPRAASTTSGLLRAPLAALRQAIRGLPLTDLLGMRGVVWQSTPDATLPDDLFVFVPAEYGERYLLRVAAKYGAGVLFQEDGESDRGA